MGQHSNRQSWRRGLLGWIVAGVLAAMTPLALVGCSDANHQESAYAANWGPGVGTQAPLLAANDQDGNPQTLSTLTGASGLLVVFNRSIDW